MNHSRDREATSGGGETILLVEDEAFVRNVASAVLESAGYKVLAVRNADEARQMYEQQSGLVDLLLTDIVLPGEDGRRLATRLARMNSALQILLITGYSEHVARSEGGEDRQSLLQKPFTASSLREKVSEMLDRRQRVPLAEDWVQARLR